jgi:hypothetical protein
MTEPTAIAAAKAATPAPVPECLLRVLDSRAFEKTPALRSLLAYLWQYRDDAISEYAIGTEALGRNSLFDPKTDATVRVQVSRLRQRLDKYYEEEGKCATERVVIPMGSHRIQVEPAESTAPVPAIPAIPILPESPAVAKAQRSRFAVLLGVCGCLAALSLGLGVALLRGRTGIQAAQPVELPRFWKTFFSNRRPARIALPTPVFFAFGQGESKGSILIRDTAVNEYRELEKSDITTGIIRKLGPPSLAQCYTVTSDTFASVQLARYLERGGKEVAVHSSADATLQALDEENVIAIGTWGTLSVLTPYLDRMNLRLEARETSVTIRRPGPGEPPQVSVAPESPSRAVWPGVIALLPGNSGRARLLILGGRDTSSLVSFLTTTDGLRQLDKLWRAKGSPGYFELLVQVETDGDRLVASWPALLLPYTHSARVPAP